jgi:hypothetical protein
MEKLVSNPAVYKPCWFSYHGAVQGVLNSLGVDVSLSDVIAVTGYGWLTNAMKKNLCPSVPSAFHADIWKGNYKATENLGIKIDMIGSGQFVWGEDRKPTPESVENSKKQFDLIKQEIDNNRPVVLWGIPVPEYGIVNGYKDEDYIVSTYRPLIGQPDFPIHHTSLMAPCGLMFMRFRNLIELDREQVVLETIERGYKIGSGNVSALDEYVVGPKAYDTLVSNLTGETFDANSYHGTAYTIACLTEAKTAVSDYLKQNDPIVEPVLMDAANLYGKLSKVLNECHMEFPMGPGEMGKEKCEKVSNLLVEAKALEIAALTSINQALL